MQKINLIIKLTDTKFELSIYLKQKNKKKTSGLKCANFEKNI